MINANMISAQRDDVNDNGLISFYIPLGLLHEISIGYCYWFKEILSDPNSFAHVLLSLSRIKGISHIFCS